MIWVAFYVTREWAREIAQWLPALALAEDPDYVPNTHMVAPNICSSRSREPDAF